MTTSSKTNMNEELKEQTLKKIAIVIKSWIKQNIDFKVAHKEIGDILETAISKAKIEGAEEIFKMMDEKYESFKITSAVAECLREYRKLLTQKK